MADTEQPQNEGRTPDTSISVDEESQRLISSDTQLPSRTASSPTYSSSRCRSVGQIILRNRLLIMRLLSLSLMGIAIGLFAAHSSGGFSVALAFMITAFIIMACGSLLQAWWQYAIRLYGLDRLRRLAAARTPNGENNAGQEGLATVEIRGSHVQTVVRIPVSHLQLMLHDGNFGPDSYDTLLALDDAVPRGAEPSEITALPTFPFTKHLNNDDESPMDENSSCSICLESFQSGEKVKLLPCLHRFHESCIDTWLQQSIACPICKISIRDAAANSAWSPS